MTSRYLTFEEINTACEVYISANQDVADITEQIHGLYQQLLKARVVAKASFVARKFDTPVRYMHAVFSKQGIVLPRVEYQVVVRKNNHVPKREVVVE